MSSMILTELDEVVKTHSNSDMPHYLTTRRDNSGLYIVEFQPIGGVVPMWDGIGYHVLQAMHDIQSNTIKEPNGGLRSTEQVHESRRESELTKPSDLVEMWIANPFNYMQTQYLKEQGTFKSFAMWCDPSLAGGDVVKNFASLGMGARGFEGNGTTLVKAYQDLNTELVKYYTN